jgi:hypothetical protein
MNADNKNKTIPVINLLNDKHSSLAALLEKASSIQATDRKIKKLLDPTLKDKFELANINADVAVILVNSSAWATRLRYNIPIILDILNKDLNYTSIKTVRIKIKKAIPENPVLNKKPNSISANSAQFLNDVANNFNDPELRACILKLSKNHS